MKRALSIIVFLLCCVAAASYVYTAVTMLPYAITKESEDWGVWFFNRFIAPLMAGGTLLLGVVPSGILYKKSRRRLDGISLCISSITLGFIVITWILAEPLRHWIIFGGR